MDKFSSYRKVLLETSNEREFEKVSSLFSDDLLEEDGFPNEYLEFLIEIISDPSFYSKEGAFHFLAVVGVDTDIMTHEQLNAISDAILGNFINYEDEMLCITSCDFIARYYSHDEAERILLKLKSIEDQKSEKGFADDGLRILQNERERSRSK